MDTLPSRYGKAYDKEGNFVDRGSPHWTVDNLPDDFVPGTVCECFMCKVGKERDQAKEKQKEMSMTAKEALVIRIERAAQFVKDEEYQQALIELSAAHSFNTQLINLLTQADKVELHVEKVKEALTKSKEESSNGAK